MNEILDMLIEVNNIFVYDYFKFYINEIRRLNRTGNTKNKDYLLEYTYPNVCNRNELNKLVHFVIKLMNRNQHMTIKDICLALLMAYYNISVFEYDDILNNVKIINYSQNIQSVLHLYMSIVGISYSIKSPEFSCCYKVENIEEYDFDCKIHKDIRRYMLFGIQ